jgi:thymidylate synthase (FAD)
MNKPPINDPRLRVETLASTPNPQKLVHLALHQDYSAEPVADWQTEASEQRSGEIAVQRLLKGDRGHYGCYSADTEVLTADGWKFWSEVTSDDSLLAVSPDTEACWFEKPSALQAYEVAEGDKLYAVSNCRLDFLVTADHRMIYSYRRKTGNFSDWQVAQAREIAGRAVRYKLNSCLSDDARIAPHELMSYDSDNALPSDTDPIAAFRLAGFFFGDGVRSGSKEPGCIRFRVRRPRKIAYLYSLGLPIVDRKGDRFTISQPGLAQWIHRHFSSDTGKVAPPWLMRLPIEYIAAFWDGLKNSDGTKIKEKTWCNHSSDKAQLDLIQATAVVNGFSANMMLNNANADNENHRPCWRLHISERSTQRVEACQRGRTPGVTEEWVEYSGKVYCATVSTGALMVRRNNKPVVLGNCLEHPQITLNAIGFPHSVMQQARTHRVGVSFDVQSFRYTSASVLEVARGDRPVEDVFYFRPVGEYRDREGDLYAYTEAMRQTDIDRSLRAAKDYLSLTEQGLSEEHARDVIPFCVRQHFVVSFNLRSALHFLDLRYKANAQLEIQQLAWLIWLEVRKWTPEIAAWYEDRRLGKAKLSP